MIDWFFGKRRERPVGGLGDYEPPPPPPPDRGFGSVTFIATEQQDDLLYQVVVLRDDQVERVAQRVVEILNYEKHRDWFEA